jgi:hypothetical protein
LTAPASDPPFPADAIDSFLIAHGGPFYELQQRLGLLHEHALMAGRRAVIAVAMCWLVPLVLSALAGRALGPLGDRPFLLDPAAWARFALAIAIFILIERQVEQRLRGVLRQLVRAPLVAPAAMPAAASAVARALRRRDAAIAEAIVLALALSLSIGGGLVQLATPSPSWFMAVDAGGQGSLTLAGWWVLLVAAPLFWFLMLRWLWRHVVWALLLRDLARLDLRLVATHPDGMGGIAFVCQYPNVFAAYVFALSGVVAAALAHALLSGVDITLVPKVMVIWLIIVAALFALPLAAFAAPLAKLKRSTLLASSALATRQQRAAERETLGSNVAAPDPDEAVAGEAVPDQAKLYAAAVRLRTFPISKAVLLPLGAAALLPLVAAGATQMPINELLKVAKGLLL